MENEKEEKRMLTKTINIPHSAKHLIYLEMDDAHEKSDRPPLLCKHSPFCMYHNAMIKNKARQTLSWVQDCLNKQGQPYHLQRFPEWKNTLFGKHEYDCICDLMDEHLSTDWLKVNEEGYMPREWSLDDIELVVDSGGGLVAKNSETYPIKKVKYLHNI